MRIADFITQHQEEILQQWEDFARTIDVPNQTLDTRELRDHAAQMLDAVVADLRSVESSHEQAEKSQGRGKQSSGETSGEAHGSARFESGFSIEQIFSEYRALRASVLRLWA